MTNSLASLSDKALALEAALQSSSMPRDTLEEAAAWKELGDTQTQDEKELAGTRALEESVRVYERIREKVEKGEGQQEMAGFAKGMGEALMVIHLSSVSSRVVPHRVLIETRLVSSFPLSPSPSPTPTSRTTKPPILPFIATSPSSTPTTPNPFLNPLAERTRLTHGRSTACSHSPF